jgi:hypothetical protein
MCHCVGKKNPDKILDLIAVFAGQVVPQWPVGPFEMIILMYGGKKNPDKMLDLNAVFAGQLVLQWDHLISHVWEQEKSGQNVGFKCSFCRTSVSQCQCRSDHLNSESHMWWQEKSGQNVGFNWSFGRTSGSPVGPFEFSCVLARKIRTKCWI